MPRKPEELEELRFRPTLVTGGPQESKAYVPEYPPSSLEDAEEQLYQLYAQILEIDSQLEDSTRTNPDGSKMSSVEYTRWRAKAKAARNIKIAQRARLKAWHQRNSKPSGVTYIPPDLQKLLVGLDALFEGLIKDGVEFSVDEMDLIDDLERYTLGIDTLP